MFGKRTKSKEGSVLAHQKAAVNLRNAGQRFNKGNVLSTSPNKSPASKGGTFGSKQTVNATQDWCKE